MITLQRKAKKDKKSRGLSLTLVIAFLSFVLAVMLIWGSFGVLFSFQAQQKIVFSKQQLIAQNAANTVVGFIQDKLSVLETTARLLDPGATSPQERDRILNHLLGPYPVFRNLILLDSKKQKMAAISRLSREGSDKLDKRFGNDLFTQTRRDKIYVSPVYVDDVTSEPMILMAVPVNDVFGNYHAVLIAEVNLKFMWDLVGGMKVGNTGLAYVVDKQGKLIAFGDISRVLKGENTSNVKVVDEFMKDTEPTTENRVIFFTGINGESVIGTYVSLGNPDWALVTELPAAEAYHTVIRTILTIALFTILMAALAGWLGVYLARRLSAPIINVMKTAARIAGGEINLQVEVSGPAEISSLAEAFNSMTAQLREIINKLEQRSRSLQKTVQEYVEYMDDVGKGRLDARLALRENGEETAEPLIRLGRQLNDTTANLQKKIEQIQETTNKLLRQEEILKMYSVKLEHSNKELEQFAYIASHDLQEPLRKLFFFGDRLREEYGKTLDGNALDYINRMNNAILRMQSLIKDLLEYSRVTTKNKPFETTDLNVIMKGVIDDLEIRIRETGAEISAEPFPNVYADPLQMRQLFQNIIGNAIKYHRENVAPVINLASRIIKHEEDHYCEIEIRDNGIGFDNRYSDQIFGLFQRLHGRSAYEGTGIGLSICKKIVEQHGGVIRASGTEGEGATFYITLPLQNEDNRIQGSDPTTSE